MIPSQKFQGADVCHGVGAPVHDAGEDDELHLGLVVGLMDHVEVAGDDGHMLEGVQAVDQVHGGGAGVDVEGVAVLDAGLGALSDPALFLGVELGALGEQGHLLPLKGPDAAVDLLHRAGVRQVGHVGADRVHGHAEFLPQLLHGDRFPPGHQGLDLLAAVVLHMETSFPEKPKFFIRP